MKKCIANSIISIILIISTAFLIALPVMVYAGYTEDQQVSKVLREFNLDKKLKDKSQIISGPCWAFASIATIEASLARKNMLDAPLSEKHLLNWCNRKMDESGYHTKIYDGGAETLSSAYLLSGAGPYREDQCPYNVKDCNYTKLNQNPAYSVRGVKYINKDVNSIKAAISEYGAVAVGYEVPYIYSHSVSLIGWDENKKMWLAKDSGKNDSSYTWLSFDIDFFECYAYTDIKKYNDNEKIYQYDEFGIVNAISSKSLICANVYSFNKGDTLNSVMMYSESAGAKCNIYLANVDANGRPIGTSTSSWTCVKRNAVVPHRGYFTINTNKVNVEGKTAVIVEMTNNNKDVSIGFAKKEAKVGKLKVFSDNTNNSYRLLNGKFSNVSEDNFLRNAKVDAFSIKAIVKKG